MASIVLAPTPNTQEEAVGQVFVSFDVSNAADVDRMEDRELGPADVRRTALDDVLMDSGATHLCLPADVIARLGLRFSFEAPVEIPTGTTTRRVFRNARVTYEDRFAIVSAVELPVGRPPLLGAIPMEELGIEPDLRNRRVRKLPMDMNSSFLRA